MTDVVVVYRIATDTPDYESDDVTGHGARLTGGRWNRPGTPMLYASVTRALACLETLAHLGGELLPLNRYLVEISVPAAVWRGRTVLDTGSFVGWEALPAGRVSIDWGTGWVHRGQSLIADVPSVVVPEERNLLVNPLHRDAVYLRARKVRRWTYDAVRSRA